MSGAFGISDSNAARLASVRRKISQWLLFRHGDSNLFCCDSIKISMPYATGEHPEVGDRVYDRHHRFGTVTHIMRWGGGSWELVIKWEDGTLGIRNTSHEEFVLVSRRDGQEVVLNVR
jgi:hypothetical protein